MGPNEDHIEPAAEMLSQPADEGAMAALNAALAGEPAPKTPGDAETPPADPQPGDPTPPPDSAPRAPESDGATDPDDNAPPSETPKPDDKKTVEPTDPKVDDPAVEVPGQPKRPSDEFGELDKDAPVKTRERFEAMKTSYDKVTEERDSAVAEANQWVETIQSTGATPEQFGMTLQYLRSVNEGTPESLNRAYDMMVSELTTLATALGREVPGIVDPLAAYPDLQKKVDDDDIDRETALETARLRTQAKIGEHVTTQRTTATAQQQAQDAGLRDVTAFGETKRTTDPAYAQKMAAIKPLIERVVAKLPPDEWVAAISEAYNAVQVAPTKQPDPVVDTPAPLRPTSTPAGNGLDKTPGSAREALDMALSQL